MNVINVITAIPRVPEGTEHAFTRPDDWHLHLRDGSAMRDVIGFSAVRFKRALIMPNLKPPVTTVEQARAYRECILTALPEGSDFTPLVTLYLTDNTPPGEIERAKKCGFIHALKCYPAGATTNSDAGITSFVKVRPALEAAQEVGMVVSLHGEVTEPGVDIFEREKWFIGSIFLRLIDELPDARFVLEHITTAHAVKAVMEAGKNVAATITVHHLLANRNDMLVGGIRPDLYCLPIVKTMDDQWALLSAATSGKRQFFLGTDSAPHATHAKYSSCGSAGCFTAHAALELYAEAFDSVGKLDMLEGFASHFGADFYGMPRNTGTITLIREDREVPKEYPFGIDLHEGIRKEVTPFRAGGTVQWKVK